MTDPVPSKDVDLPTLMAWLRERHSYLVGLGAKETYEGLIHAHIERLERRLNECGLECSEGLKRLAAENERLRACLTGIASCASCEMCRGAAQRAPGEPIERELAAKMVARCEHGNPIDPTGGYVCLKCFNTAKPVLPFTHWSKDPLIPYEGCNCSSCDDARTLVKIDLSNGTAQHPGPTCVHPFHRLKLDDGGVMWCRECEATLLLFQNFGGAAQPPGDDHAG